MVICERCATQSPSGYRYCGTCGAPLPTDPLDRDARKIVTALFCDVADSTGLGEQLDPEALHHVLGRYFDIARATIERHGGTVQKYAGDAVLAVFGIPQIHEDDALRAVRAAVDIRGQLPELERELGIPLRLRTGVNTGVVLTDEGRNLALGDAVNVAARLEQAASPGEILLGPETRQLVRDAVDAEPLEPLALRGKREPLQAFRLRALDPTAPAVARRLEIPLVNRRRELEKLRETWQRTLASSSCRLVTLVGAAGVGKSRLAEELLAEVGPDARVLRGRCLPYGEGITFWPIEEALAPVGESAAAVLGLISGGGAATPEELFWRVRQLLESLAAERPLILYVDDLQWGESMLIELLSHIVTLSRGAPLLLLCTGRPELFDEHTQWSRPSPAAITIRLDTLGDDDCERLLDQLDDRLERDARRQVIRSSEGNPLFLQEMLILARERGSVEVPPTIQALLAARLERLPSSQRELLARGAVEGQVFHRSAVAVLAGGSDSDVDSQLEALAREDLIRPHPPDVPGDRAFRFRHLLIRDAAYERLPKATRAELHALYAGWLERAGVAFAEVDEIAGWHLEQAVRHRRDARRSVETRLSCRAAEHLYAAGRRAVGRSDSAAARNLLERALELAPGEDPLRSQVGVALAELLVGVGDLARADEILEIVERESGDREAAALVRLEWLIFSQPAAGKRTIEAQLPAMLERLSQARDDRGQAKVHWLAFWSQWAASQATLAAEQARRSAEHAQLAGDFALWSRALGWYVATLIYGPLDAAEMATELEGIELQQPGPYLQACVALGRAEVERLHGDFAAARTLAQSALDGFRGLGMHVMAATADQSFAAIELSAGRPHAAVTALQRSDGILAEFGESVMRSTTQAMLARALAEQGSVTRARSATALAEELSAPEDRLNFATTDGTSALLSLADGALSDAERSARSAVARAAETDFVVVQADAHLVLARVLAAEDRTDQARAAARTAGDLYERKGDRPGSAAADRLLMELAAL
jgi:class 3 adenylate cyclase